MSVKPSFRKIYEEHSSLVLTLSLSYLRSREDAEDALQEIFVKVHEQLDRFDGKSSLKTWIYRITVNHCLDRIKASKRKKRFAFLQSLSSDQSTVQPAHFEHPGIQLENKEAMNRLLATIGELPGQQATILLLKYQEGLSVKAIAEIVEASEKSVESTLTRARNNLKKKLNPKD